jgi:catechol 2,3-dioxygenase-like lactoylglutathione lyase family enzyme
MFSMSHVFGNIRQNGYVVRDIEAAMQHWVEVLGVGPFFYMPHIACTSFEYRGRPGDPDISIALANSGDLQIELIQQHCDSPTLYKDFLDAGREGLQHVSAWDADIDATVDRLTAAGHRIAQRGSMQGGVVKFVYFDTEAHPGTVFEISNMAGDLEYIPAMVADAARDWDGSDPVRKID